MSEPFEDAIRARDNPTPTNLENCAGMMAIGPEKGAMLAAAKRIAALEAVAEAAEEVCLDLQLNEGTYYARLNDELIAAGYLGEGE